MVEVVEKNELNRCGRKGQKKAPHCAGRVAIICLLLKIPILSRNHAKEAGFVISVKTMLKR